MPTYREPLTEDEKLMKKDGWNVDEDNDPNKDEMECICGWIGTRGQLMSATGLKDDVEYIYCPECGSDDVGEV